MKGFLKCPKINRIIEYKAYCAFDCPNGTNITAYSDKPPVVECLVDGKKYSVGVVRANEIEKLTDL